MKQYQLTDEEAKAVGIVAKLYRERDCNSVLYVTPEQMPLIDPEWKDRWFGWAEKGEEDHITPFHSMCIYCPIPDEFIERDELK